MKRYLHFFFIFLTSVSLFFSFNRNVKADTYDLSIPTSDFSYVTSEYFNACKDSLNSLLSDSTPYYIIFYNSGTNYIEYNTIYAFILSAIPSNKIVSFDTNYMYVNMYVPRNTPRYACNSSTNEFVAGRTFNNYTFYNLISNNELRMSILDTNIPLTVSNTANTYNITSDYYSYTIGGSDSPIYSLYEIYSHYTPTPSDDTPILTDYYSLIVDKLSLLTNYFYTNKYLLAIPIIPILLLILYFIRRSIIK